MTNKEIKTQQRPIENQWSSLKLVLVLCVLLELLFRISYFLEFVFYEILNLPYDSLFACIAEIVLQAACFIVVISVGLKNQKKTLASVCSFKKVNGNVLVAAILCSIGYTLFDFYIQFLFFSFRYGWDTNYGEAEGFSLFNLIDTAIIPAVAEEILFKGLVFTILKKYYPTIVAIIIASILFAACHLSFIGFIPHFLFSCFTFFLYLRSGSLILPMVLHFTNNLFTFILISEPFTSLGTFYAALALFGVGSYMLYNVSKTEKTLQQGVKDVKK